MVRTRLPAPERRRQIAETALRILAEQGVRRLTAQQIAGAIGVTDGSIFRHFKDKDEIVDAAIARFEELMGGDFPPEHLPPIERLGTFFKRRLAKVRERPEIMRLAFNDRLQEAAGPRGAERVMQVIGHSLAFVQRCLEEARAQGLVADDVPVEQLVWMVMGAMRGAALGLGLSKPRMPEPELAWEPLERLLLRSAQDPVQDSDDASASGS